MLLIFNQDSFRVYHLSGTSVCLLCVVCMCQWDQSVCVWCMFEWGPSVRACVRRTTVRGFVSGVGAAPTRLSWWSWSSRVNVVIRSGSTTSAICGKLNTRCWTYCLASATRPSWLTTTRPEQWPARMLLPWRPVSHSSSSPLTLRKMMWSIRPTALDGYVGSTHSANWPNYYFKRVLQLL